MNVRELEHAAKAAFARGDNWHDFVTDMGPSIRAAAPVGREYRRLTDTLLALVVSGNDAGHRPIDVDEPGRRGDGQPDDATTAATVQTTFPWILGRSTTT